MTPHVFDLSPPVDGIVPAPAEVSRRAWECAFDLGQEHSCTIRHDALWFFFQGVVTGRNPDGLTWRECATLFRAHRHYRRERTA